MFKQAQRFFAVQGVLTAICCAYEAPPDFSDVEVITFDFYAALMDTVASLKRNAVPIIGSDKISQTMNQTQVDALISGWAKQYSGYVGVVNALQHNEELQWGDKDLFKMMLSITLEHACATQDVNLSADTKKALVESWKHLKPWSNTAKMLRALKGMHRADGQPRFRLAVLSNADHEFLKAGCADLEAEANMTFDAYLGCDGLGVNDVCLFKPEPVFYGQVRTLITNPGDDWKRRVLHVAGAMYDANGAKAFGFRNIWNSNSSRPIFFDYTGTGKNTPDVILHEIGELPAVLGGLQIHNLLV